ncbi:MAG: site-specific integrase, partial [Verrucomicrobia bacterium]|nr:site-specific integrase [Verrucomicrobiota bacterium]
REKINAMKAALPSVEGRVRLMAALLLYTGMRFEEVLGLRWEDITDEWITVSRAVVHPTRNLPVVKCPKTKTSERRIPLAEPLKELLTPKYKSGFILFSDRSPKRDSPLSYTEARRVFDKIRRQFGLEKYTAHDFRDTCATEWRENGMSLDLIARLLGHAKTETTERRYVKYRADIMTGAREMM